MSDDPSAGLAGAVTAPHPGSAASAARSNAFVPPGASEAPEGSGFRLAVKDVFDVAGVSTGAGSPRWLNGAVP